MSSMHRILAVDDNDRNLTILQKLFEREYEVMTARTGEEAVMLARTFRPDVVLLDIMMPGMDGYETCRQIRCQESGARTKILMVTARAMQSERIHGYECGADDYVTKPFDHDELVAKVRVYTALRSVQEIDRLRQGLLDLLRHETQTPMSIIIASLELLAGEPDLAPTHRQMSAIALEAAKGLTALIDRALLLSRLRAGNYAIESSPAALDSLIKAAVASRQGRLDAKRLELRSELGPELTVQVDHLFEELVVGAILDCQIDRCAPGSRLAIRVESLGAPRVSIRIARPAAENDAEFAMRAFEAFEVHDLQHHSSGDGLGLAIARALTIARGGSLDIELDDGELRFHLVLGTAEAPIEQRLPA
jgi:DNA-binding response OmpR family regulator